MCSTLLSIVLTPTVLIAECLRARLLILQCVFSAGGVWPQLPSCLEMQLKV